MNFTSEYTGKIVYTVKYSNFSRPSVTQGTFETELIFRHFSLNGKNKSRFFVKNFTEIEKYYVPVRFDE